MTVLNSILSLSLVYQLCQDFGEIQVVSFTSSYLVLVNKSEDVFLWLQQTDSNHTETFPSEDL